MRAMRWKACGAVFLLAAAVGAQTQPRLTTAVSQWLAKGDTFAAHKDWQRARDAYGRADKLAHKSCVQCDVGMFAADRGKGDYSGAIKDAERAIKSAGNDKKLAAQAHLLRGALLGSFPVGPKDKKLREAEQDLRAAVALDPSLVIAHYDLGIALCKQGRDTDGVAEFNTYLAAPQADARLVAEAKEMIADPARVREPVAPDFSFHALDGTQVSSAALRGKVLLLDFWGTWCGPCRESVPELLTLRKKFEGQDVQFVGISSDTNERAWKDFVSKHGMDWPQDLDYSRAIQGAYGVRAYPTYVIVDAEGVVRLRVEGLSETTGPKLQSEIEKLLKASRTAPQNPSSAFGTAAGPKTN